jgi:phospholipid-translocating ATPase
MAGQPVGEAGGGSGQDSTNEGLRRRHSGATEDDELGTTPSSEQQNVPYTIEGSAAGPARRRSTGGSTPTHQKRKSLSSAVDFEGPVATGEETERRQSRDSSLHDSPKVVRFSQEIDRSDSDAAIGNSRHLQGLGLSVITSNDGESVLGEGRVQSPVTLTQASATPAEATRPGIPQSPKTRNRGWSLRRTLLNRAFDSPSSAASPSSSAAHHAARNSIIELEEVSQPGAGPSNRAQQSDTITSSENMPYRSPSKKSNPVVTVSPSIEQFEAQDKSIIPDRLTLKKGLQGISALPHYESWTIERARHNVYVRKLRAGYHKLRKAVLRIQEIPPSKDGRHIPLDATRKKALIDERTKRPYVENWIRSSRYSAWNFVPRQLFAQFSKLANFYFLVVATLQMIPSKSIALAFRSMELNLAQISVRPERIRLSSH